MKYIVLILIVGTFLSCSNKVDFTKIESFEVYKEKGILPKDITKNVSTLKIKQDEVIPILKSAKKNEGIHLWKGHLLGRVIFEDGTTHYLKISNYGGFFYDITNDNLYQIEEELNQKWYDLFK